MVSLKPQRHSKSPGALSHGLTLGVLGVWFSSNRNGTPSLPPPVDFHGRPPAEARLVMNARSAEARAALNEKERQPVEIVQPAFGRAAVSLSSLFPLSLCLRPTLGVLGVWFSTNRNGTPNPTPPVDLPGRPATPGPARYECAQRRSTSRTKRKGNNRARTVWWAERYRWARNWLGVMPVSRLKEEQK